MEKNGGMIKSHIRSTLKVFMTQTEMVSGIYRVSSRNWTI